MASFFISDLRERAMHDSMYFGFIQQIRGPIFTTYPRLWTSYLFVHVTNCGHSNDHLPTSSCPLSYWRTPFVLYMHVRVWTDIFLSLANYMCREIGIMYLLNQVSGIATTGFWGKEAWRPTPKWNTRFFFVFPKEIRYGLKEFSHFLQTKGSHSKVRLDTMPLFLLDYLLIGITKYSKHIFP